LGFAPAIIVKWKASGIAQQITYTVNHHPKWVLKGRKVGGSDIQLISVVKQIFFPDKSKLASKII